MSGMPGNIAPADVAASELPEGFSLAGPGGGGGGGGPDSAADQAAQRDAQRQSILEQAMTPDALARLRRVKVSEIRPHRAAIVLNLRLPYSSMSVFS